MVTTDQRENHQAREQGSKALKMKDPEEAKPPRHNREGQRGPGQAASSRSAAPEADLPCLLCNHSYSEREKQCYFQRLPRDVTIWV